LEGTRRPDDGSGGQFRPRARRGLEQTVVSLESLDLRAQLHRRRDVARVRLKVVGDLVLGGIALRIAGNRRAGKGTVVAPREQRQRVEALAPAVANSVEPIDERDPLSGLREFVP